MHQKAATPIDQIIGARIRARRLAVGISQEKLAAALGLTFQQIQKYEKGVNRVTAGRLVAIAQVLGAPVDAFFDLDRSPIDAVFLEDADLHQLLMVYAHLPDHKKELVQQLCADLARIDSGRVDEDDEDRSHPRSYQLQ
jgi:transcriptional regulator with XRE-family HTH domain